MVSSTLELSIRRHPKELLGFLLKYFMKALEGGSLLLKTV